ncbi:UNVERIFIED_CONTAM: hypothetical protein K2H54_028245 [Gekko kuhli]
MQRPNGSLTTLMPGAHQVEFLLTRLHSFAPQVLSYSYLDGGSTGPQKCKPPTISLVSDVPPDSNQVGFSEPYRFVARPVRRATKGDRGLVSFGKAGGGISSGPLKRRLSGALSSPNR